MVQDLNFDIEIIVAPIVREPDGLAMSSRNVYLSPGERADAVVLSQSLRLAEQFIRNGEGDPRTIIKHMQDFLSSKPTAQIDYISIANAATLEELTRVLSGDTVLISLAVRFGTTRLIDNTLVTIP